MAHTDYISREEVMKMVEKYSYAVVIDLGMRKDIISIPSLPEKSLQIKELIEKKQESIKFMYQGKEPLVKKGNPIHYGALLCCQQLLSEIDSL